MILGARVLLPLALLKSEGEFTARPGRVKIYCRASSVVARTCLPVFARCSPRAVKLRRKSNNSGNKGPVDGMTREQENEEEEQNEARGRQKKRCRAY